MAEVDLEALNLSYAQVKVLMGRSPIGRVRPSDVAHWKCNWKDCPYAFDQEVDEAAEYLDWPIEMIDHVFVNKHYGLNTDR